MFYSCKPAPLVFCLLDQIFIVTLFLRFSAVKEGDRNSGSFYILVDDAKKAVIDGDTPNPNNGHPQGSCTITLELTAGQEVKIMNYQSTTLLGTHSGCYHSWFTGFLLYAI